MTQHPLIALSREELRGWIACTRHMDTLSVRLGAEERALVVMLELQDVAQALLDRQTPRPVTSERVAEWGARFEAAAQRAPNHEARPWYQPAGGNPLARFCGTLLGALRCWGVGEWQGMGVTSNEWEGERWAAILPTLDGPPEAVLALTMEALKTAMVVRKAEFASSRATTETGARDLAHDAQPSRGEGDNAAPTAPLAAAPTPEEQRQPGLADAVAKSLAEQPPRRPPVSGHAPGWPAETVERCRALLVDQGLTYVEAHNRTGVPVGTISGWAHKRKWMDGRQPRTEPIPDRSSLVWTEERLALLDAEFATADLDALLARVNALPGPSPCASVAALRQKAKLRGLRRRAEAEPAPAPPPDETPAPETPPPTQPATPIKPTPEMLPEDKAEAREKLRTGEFKGARDIIEEYGCTQAEAQALVDEHRNRMGKAA